MCWILLIVALNRWGITRLTALARAHILGLSNLPGLHCFPPSLFLYCFLSSSLAYTSTFTFNSLTTFSLYLSLSLTVFIPFFLSVHPAFSVSWLCPWAKSRSLILILPECLQETEKREQAISRGRKYWNVSLSWSELCLVTLYGWSWCSCSKVVCSHSWLKINICIILWKAHLSPSDLVNTVSQC